MLDVWDFGGRGVIIVALALSFFGAMAGWALSSWGRMPRTLGVAVGVLTSVVGVAVLGIVALARRSGSGGAGRARQLGRIHSRGASTPSVSKQTIPGQAQSQVTGFGDLWDGGSTGFPSTVSYTPGMETASEYANLWTDSISSPSENPSSPRIDAQPLPKALRRLAWVLTPVGRWAVGVGMLSTGVAALSIVIPWVSIDAAVIPKVWVYPLGTGVDTVLAVTVAMVIAGLSISSRIPSRIAAVTIAGLADIWVTAASLMISARASLVAMLEQVGDLTLSVGDVLALLGIDIRGSKIELPDGVDLTSLGLIGHSVSASSIPLGAMIPNMTIGIEPGLFVVILFSIFANVAAIMIIRAAEVADSPPRSG